MTDSQLADDLLAAACEYMGAERGSVLSSHSREATTVRQFVAYVLVHRCGDHPVDVAATLHTTPRNVRRSVELVKSYGEDDTTRELAIDLAGHLFKVLQNCR